MAVAEQVVPEIAAPPLPAPTHQAGPWATRMIDTLCALKAAGFAFDAAWDVALEQHPPRGRDLGPERPSLFDEELGLVDFLHIEASDAWHGRRKVLRHLVIPVREGKAGRVIA